MKNQLLASAISLTNHGADKMATGEYFAAASSFCGAIRLVKELPAVVEEEDGTSSSSSSSSTTAMHDDNDDAFEAPKPWSFEALPVLSPALVHTEVAIFEHCFVVVPARQLQLHAYTAADCDLFTAALIYNLALTYHYCGIICGNKPTFQKDALALYVKASNIIGNIDSDSNDGHAIYMAVSNNAASLALTLDNGAMCRGYLACLQKLLQEKSDFYATFFHKNMSLSTQTTMTTSQAAVHDIPAQ